MEKIWKEMTRKERKEYKIAWIKSWMVQRKSKKDMSINEIKVFTSQRVLCFFGIHIFREYHLLYGRPEKDGIYKLCPLCHKVGKMLSKPIKLTSGMSRE